MADADAERAHERRIEELLRANNALLERARAAADECRMLSEQVTALDAKLAELSEWRPIETAPEEMQHGNWLRRYTEDGVLHCPDGGEATHWLPLPEPPHD